MPDIKISLHLIKLSYCPDRVHSLFCPFETITKTSYFYFLTKHFLYCIYDSKLFNRLSLLSLLVTFSSQPGPSASAFRYCLLNPQALVALTIYQALRPHTPSPTSISPSLTCPCTFRVLRISESLFLCAFRLTCFLAMTNI